MHIVSLKGYNHIYAIDSFWDDFAKLFNKGDKQSYQQEKEFVLESLDLLENYPLSELERTARFERLSTEDLYVIRHRNKKNTRVVFITTDDEGDFILLNSFFEKNRSDYEIAKKDAKRIIKTLNESEGG